MALFLSHKTSSRLHTEHHCEELLISDCDTTSSVGVTFSECIREGLKEEFNNLVIKLTSRNPHLHD